MTKTQQHYWVAKVSKEKTQFFLFIEKWYEIFFFLRCKLMKKDLLKKKMRYFNLPVWVL